MPIPSTVTVEYDPYRGVWRWCAYATTGWESRRYRHRRPAALAARIYAAFSRGRVRYVP